MIVPVWNSKKMEAHLLSSDKKVVRHYYPNASHFTLFQSEDFLRQLNSPLEDFLNPFTDTNNIFSEANAIWPDE